MRTLNCGLTTKNNLFYFASQPIPDDEENKEHGKTHSNIDIDNNDNNDNNSDKDQNEKLGRQEQQRR